MSKRNRSPGAPAAGTAQPTPRRSVGSAVPERLATAGADPVIETAASATSCLVVDREISPEHLFRRLLSAYLAGSDRIELDESPALTARTRAVIDEFCRRTRGSEASVVRAGRLAIALPPTGGAGDWSVELRRLGETVVRFHHEAVASWAHLPFGDDDRWSRRDDAIDREAWFLERSIASAHEGGRVPAVRPIDLWTVVRSLERIADHAVTLGETGPRLAELAPDGALLRELHQFHRQAMAHLEGVLGCADGVRANELLDVGEALLAGGRALSERLLPAVADRAMSPATSAAVARIVEAISRTIAYGQDIAQAKLDRPAPSSNDPPPRVAAIAAI
jgi:phosphate uptake regulator